MSKRNENRLRYKKTKVGWIPKEWECVPGRRVFSNSSEKGYKGLPILAVTMESGLVHRNFLDRKMPNSISAELSLLVRAGDIAYNMMRAWQGAFGLVMEEGIISPAYIVLRPKKDVHSPFMYYLFKSSHCLYYLKSYSYGITGDRLRLYYKDFGMIPIPLPSLPEQKKIAKILSAWDRAINQAGKLIDAKQRLKKRLRQQLLTGWMRFPKFGKPAHKEGKLPEGWKSVRLGDVTSIRRGASPRPISDPKWFAEKGRGWIRISDVTESSTFLNATTQYLSTLGEGKSVKVDPGDLILSICATIGVPIILNIPACIHDGFVVIRDYEESIEKAFLFSVLSSLKEHLSGQGQPGTQKNLNTTIVGNIRIKLPSTEEQIRIAIVLSTCDQEIELLRKKESALRQQKKGLMQKLLTGEVRVKVDSEALK